MRKGKLHLDAIAGWVRRSRTSRKSSETKSRRQHLNLTNVFLSAPFNLRRQDRGGQWERENREKTLYGSGGRFTCIGETSVDYT